MKHILYIGLAVAAFLTLRASGEPAEAKAIEGMWRPVTAELAGKPMSETVLKTISLKLEDASMKFWSVTIPIKAPTHSTWPPSLKG